MPNAKANANREGSDSALPARTPSAAGTARPVQTTTKQVGTAVAMNALVAAALHLALGLGSTLGAGVLFGTSAAS